MATTSIELPQYRVQRKAMHSYKPYGKVHLSHNGDNTLCGQNMNEKFVILPAADKEQCDCKDCLVQLGKDIIKG